MGAFNILVGMRIGEYIVRTIILSRCKVYDVYEKYLMFYFYFNIYFITGIIL